MSKSRPKKKTKILPLFILGLVLVALLSGFLYKENYPNCLPIEPIACFTSSRYISPSKQFSFRYPHNYPITYRTGAQMVEQYRDNEYDEWVNFSTEFYLNAGGDRLGSIMVTKNTKFKSVQEYANEKQGYFDKLPDQYKGKTPKVEFLKISGKNAVRITTDQQPSSFDPPSDEYILVENGKLYRISFNFNDYYHKEPLTYYENSKKIILSTFSFN